MPFTLLKATDEVNVTFGFLAYFRLLQALKYRVFRPLLDNDYISIVVRSVVIVFTITRTVFQFSTLITGNIKTNG